MIKSDELQEFVAFLSLDFEISNRIGKLPFKVIEYDLRCRINLRGMALLVSVSDDIVVDRKGSIAVGGNGYLHIGMSGELFTCRESLCNTAQLVLRSLYLLGGQACIGAFGGLGACVCRSCGIFGIAVMLFCIFSNLSQLYEENDGNQCYGGKNNHGIGIAHRGNYQACQDNNNDQWESEL